MQITIVGSAVGRGEQHQYLISYVVNRHLAIDAGCIGCITPLSDQKAIKHVFLSHTHIDHTASLPCFLDNVFQPDSDGVRLYASQATSAVLARDFFNDATWPDLVRLSQEESPFFALESLVSEQSVTVEGLQIRPVELNHVVPTFGFVIADERSSVAIVSDTAPSERIWQILNEVPNLRGVFLEASFPNSMHRLAAKAKHLTPQLLREELSKLHRDVPIIAVHIKPAFRPQIISELAELGLPRLEIGAPDTAYEF